MINIENTVLMKAWPEKQVPWGTVGKTARIKAPTQADMTSISTNVQNSLIEKIK